MTANEIKNWILNAKCVDQTNEFTDSCGNVETTKIYEFEGKLYQIELQNDCPYQKWGEKGFIRGEYAEPVEVVKKTRIVEETYYEPLTN